MSWYSLAHARDFGPVHATAYGPHTVFLVTFFSIKCVCGYMGHAVGWVLFDSTTHS